MKLNFGCGKRYASGWVNIDFHSENPEVKRVNLLEPLPFSDDTFTAVYSSHTLEHFSQETTERILKECRRVMKPGGIVRIVLPDLENTCREYIRILDEVDRSELARAQYNWIVLELLDQLTRTKPSGLMDEFKQELQRKGDQRMLEYVQSRTDTAPMFASRPLSFKQKLQKLTPAKLKNKLIYAYVEAVKGLFPRSLREAILDETKIGEKHRWMYDRYSLKLLLERCGFVEVKLLNATTSEIPDFDKDYLDIERDGRVYKPGSLFCEAHKPG
ncbi:MAG TPA: methyltransferase domain-containing protein [Clostridia bacterium]|nr:methyltransferase domain-containing protein [Clostridia bacterium]